MKRVILIIVLIGLSISLWFLSYRHDHAFMVDNIFRFPDTFSYYHKAYISCNQFVEKNLLAAHGGIYTNYLESDHLSKLATGHQFLSESAGLFMLHCVMVNDKTQFDHQLSFLEGTMKNPWGLYRWRSRDEHLLTDVAATIDELRILRALMAAYKQWQDTRHLIYIQSHSDSLLKYHVNQGVLVNDYDGKQKATIIELAYLDLLTLRELQAINHSWSQVYQTAIQVVQEGFVSQKVPLYFKQYDIEEKKISETSTINMINVALVYLHLAEVEALPEDVVRWLKQQFKDYGRLYSRYGINGQPACEQESTAIYALIARMARQIEDGALYQLCVDRMLMFQIADINHELYGGFGDMETLQAFSYDNLQALLSLGKQVK